MDGNVFWKVAIRITWRFFEWMILAFFCSLQDVNLGYLCCEAEWCVNTWTNCLNGSSCISLCTLRELFYHTIILAKTCHIPVFKFYKPNSSLNIEQISHGVIPSKSSFNCWMVSKGCDAKITSITSPRSSCCRFPHSMLILLSILSSTSILIPRRHHLSSSIKSSISRTLPVLFRFWNSKNSATVSFTITEKKCHLQVSS